MRYLIYFPVAEPVEVKCYRFEVDPQRPNRIRTWIRVVQYRNGEQLSDEEIYRSNVSSIDLTFAQPIIRITDDRGRVVYKRDKSVNTSVQQNKE